MEAVTFQKLLVSYILHNTHTFYSEEKISLSLQVLYILGNHILQKNKQNL